MPDLDGCIFPDLNWDYLNLVRIELSLLENIGLALLPAFMIYNSNS